MASGYHIGELSHRVTMVATVSEACLSIESQALGSGPGFLFPIMHLPRIFFSLVISFSVTACREDRTSVYDPPVKAWITSGGGRHGFGILHRLLKQGIRGGWCDGIIAHQCPLRPTGGNDPSPWRSPYTPHTHTHTHPPHTHA